MLDSCALPDRSLLTQNLIKMREDLHMDRLDQHAIKVMRIVARMNIGGPAVQISGIMRGLDSQCFNHRLYTGICASDEADYLDTVAKDIKATRIRGLGRRLRIHTDLIALISLVREIRSFKPHIIHTHTFKAGLLGRVASIISLHSSIRVHTFHGHLLYGYFGPYKRLVIVYIEKFLARFTHQLLAVGENVKQDLLAEGIGSLNKFEVMPPGLEIGNLPNKLTARRSYSLSNEILQCALIGRVTKIKRPDRFLDVVSEIKKRGVKIEFIIAGDGELLNACRERVAREDLPVKILGWQTELERVLAAVDIVMLTSDNEGTPLILIQAGMAKKPVIATRVGSVPEVVLHGVTGFITSLEVQDIADSLVVLSKSQDLMVQFGAAGKEFTLSNFSVKRLVNDHQELYSQLLQQFSPKK